MKIEFSYSKQTLVMDFYPDEFDDVLLKEKVSLYNRSCFFQLPFEIENNIHPDLLGLVAILCVNPFTAREFVLPFPISQGFHDTVKACIKKEIGPVDNKLKPRVVDSGRPALCYSGGVDSTAALAIMPDNTCSYFIDRIIPKDKKVLYNKFAAHKAVEDVKKSGHEIYSIETNFEYLRSPVGFPVDVSTAIPSLLCADQHSTDSVAFGMTLNGVYRVGHDKFTDYRKRGHFKTWGSIFKSVGLEFFLATSGMTDVANYKISRAFDVTDFARSCMRGGEESSCMRCLKCFRKLTIESIIKGSDIDDVDVDVMLKTKEVLNAIGKRSIKLENIYRYIAYKLKDRNEFARIFNEKICIHDEDVNWMEKWYSGSIELVPLKYREEYKAKVLSYLDVMNYEDLYFVENWDKSKYVRNGGHKAWAQYLVDKNENEKLRSIVEF